MEPGSTTSETWGLLDQQHDADAEEPVHVVRNLDIPKIIAAQTKLKGILAVFANPTYKLTACAFLIYFLTEFGLITLQVPGTRLFEHAVCREYYRSNPSPWSPFNISAEIDERLCKIAPIQHEVALLSGWRDSFLAIPSEL